MGNFYLPPYPPINPVQAPQRPPLIDIMKMGLPAAPPAAPDPEQQAAATPFVPDPRKIRVPPPPPIQVQGPPAGLTPDQDMILKAAMGQAQNPMPTLAGGMQTSTRVNMPEASSYLAQPGAPPTHTMDIYNGGNKSTLKFGGPGNDILSQQDMTPMSPEDITRRMAGQLAPTEEQRVMGMQMYEAMLKNRADVMKSVAEAQATGGRLDLDRQMGLGKLGMDQQSHGLDMTQKQFAMGPEAVIAAAMQKMREGGMSEADIIQRGNEMRQRGGIPSPLGSGTQYGGGQAPGQKLGPAPSTAPPGAGPGGGTAPPPPAPPPSNLATYAPIEGTLNEYSRDASPDGGKTPGGMRGIGAFLQKLDSAKPGFVRQNWPMIEAYIKAQADPSWGERGLAEAKRMPVRSQISDMIPFSGAANLFNNPDARSQWQNWLTAALPPLGMAVKGMTGDNYLFSKPDDEALGRSALRKLLGGQ